MDFVNAHRRVVGVDLRTGPHPFLIVPLVAAQIENHASRLQPVLGKEGIWVGLQKDIAMLAADFKFVMRSLMHARKKNFPDAGWQKLPHLVNAAIPVVEVTHNTHALRGWGPHGEMNARHIVNHLHMGAELFVDVVMRAFVEEINIHLAKHCRK